MSTGTPQSPAEPRRKRDREWFSSRWALMVGFGGLLAIMAMAGIDAQRVLRQVRRRDDQIRQLYLAQNHVLNEIRSDIYVSGTYVRDYLLDPDARRADDFRTTLQNVRAHMEASLNSYGRQAAAPADAERYIALRAELAGYCGV